MFQRLTVVLCLFAILVAACAPGTPVQNGAPEGTLSTPGPAGEGSQAPTSTPPVLVGESPLAPEPLQSPLSVGVTPSAKHASVVGRLLVMDPRFAPQPEGGLWLSPLPENPEKGAIVVPEVDPDVALSVPLDRETGTFAIHEVPPGRYEILIVATVGTFPMRDPATGAVGSFVLEAGVLLDLGTVRVP